MLPTKRRSIKYVRHRRKTTEDFWVEFHSIPVNQDTTYSLNHLKKSVQYIETNNLSIPEFSNQFKIQKIKAPDISNFMIDFIEQNPTDDITSRLCQKSSFNVKDIIMTRFSHPKDSFTQHVKKFAKSSGSSMPDSDLFVRNMTSMIEGVNNQYNAIDHTEGNNEIDASTPISQQNEMNNPETDSNPKVAIDDKDIFSLPEDLGDTDIIFSPNNFFDKIEDDEDSFI